MCKKGRAEGDTAGHLPFSPALPRFPPAQPSAQEPRPPPAPVPSHSVLVLGVGSRDTRPGRGAGEVATGPADGTPIPGVHQFAREPTGPRPRPLHSPPPPDAHSALGDRRDPRAPLSPPPTPKCVGHAGVDSPQARPPPTNPIVHCAARGPSVFGYPYFPTNPDEHRASPGPTEPMPHPLKGAATPFLPRPWRARSVEVPSGPGPPIARPGPCPCPRTGSAACEGMRESHSSVRPSPPGAGEPGPGRASSGTSW